MHKSNLIVKIKRDWQLHVIILLPFIYYIIFHYIPMYGVTMAFKDFNISKGILGSPWVGFGYFEDFFNSYYFIRLVRNTFLLGLYTILFGFPVPIIFALCLNEIKIRFIKNISQTISYFPYFISTVVVIGILYNFLSINGGVVNIVLEKLGYNSVRFLGSARWFRSLYVGSTIWQSFGFNSIIYLAVISSIDPELYLAVEVDGGNRWHKIRYITLPSLKPTMMILLILAFGGVFSVGFERVILMYSEAIYSVSDVIQTFVYRRGILSGDYGYATAVGLFNSCLSFILLIIFNYISRRISETSLW